MDAMSDSGLYFIRKNSGRVFVMGFHYSTRGGALLAGMDAKRMGRPVSITRSDPHIEIPPLPGDSNYSGEREVSVTDAERVSPG